MKYIDKNGEMHDSLVRMTMSDLRNSKVVNKARGVASNAKEKAREFVNNNTPQIFIHQDEGSNFPDGEDHLWDAQDSDIDIDEPEMIFESTLKAEPTIDSTITQIIYDCELAQFQFFGGEHVIRKTADEMTPDFRKEVWDRAACVTENGTKIVMTVLKTIKADDIYRMATISSVESKDKHNSINWESLIDNQAYICLGVELTLTPSQFIEIKPDRVKDDAIRLLLQNNPV